MWNTTSDLRRIIEFKASNSSRFACSSAETNDSHDSLLKLAITILPRHAKWSVPIDKNIIGQKTRQHFNKYNKYPVQDGELYHPGNWRPAPLIKSHTFITFIRALSYVPPHELIKLHYPCTCAETSVFIDHADEIHPLFSVPPISVLSLRYSLLLTSYRQTNFLARTNQVTNYMEISESY